MITTELYAKIEGFIPRELSCGWDNDGLSVLPDPEHESGKVLVALDVREEVVEYAKKNGFDTVLTHHPLIFSGLKELSGRTVVSSKAAKLIRAGIAAMSFHTRFDALDGGVSDITHFIALLTRFRARRISSPACWTAAGRLRIRCSGTGRPLYSGRTGHP